ncbi:hypothetical protein AFM11_26380 [Mycolicibacterium wolinskyi]|uniref:Uncharacterized protein n=1 Tax=Mycolicibacterium wolinskyi TaxID=59750 RepID=A0A132PFT0_9MYCO|nr:hypothetical protein [Mycolicibacterium wolinskyi]KWX21185.1 hypothetical protein AFM11_26380 [Mycolicibacterium wolinskyi]
MRVVVTTALTGLLLATTVPVAAAEPNTVVVPEVPAEPARTVFADNPWIVDQHTTKIDSWSRHGQGLRINFTAGTPDCFGVHLTTQETAETVMVELHGGTPPEAVGRMCIALAVDGTMDVPLQGPLGGRVVMAAQ